MIDSDRETRQTLILALQSHGYDVTCFADGAALLASVKTRSPACIIVDIGPPDQSGPCVLKMLRAGHCSAPIVAMSADADIRMAVEAIKSGAVDFKAKPVSGSEMADLVKAVSITPPRSAAGNMRARRVLQVAGQKALTAKEHAVLECLIAGRTTRETALALGLSTRTVEGHRSNIRKKLGVRNAAELIRRVFSGQDQHEI